MRSKQYKDATPVDRPVAEMCSHGIAYIDFPCGQCRQEMVDDIRGRLALPVYDPSRINRDEAKYILSHMRLTDNPALRAKLEGIVQREYPDREAVGSTAGPTD